jgi:hypothetical protein
MKKFLFLALTVAFTTVSFAQVINLKSANNLSVDTVTNTGTKYMTSGAIAGRLSAMTVQVDLTELSGTTAGTITLQYSLDGVTYFTLAADSTYTATDVASQTFGWFVKSPALFKYVRVKYTGSGTMSDKIFAKAWGN